MIHKDHLEQVLKKLDRCHRGSIKDHECLCSRNNGAPRNWALDTDWWQCSGAQRELLEPEAPSGRDGPKRDASSWSFLYFPMFSYIFLYFPITMLHYASLLPAPSRVQRRSAAGFFRQTDRLFGHERNIGTMPSWKKRGACHPLGNQCPFITASGFVAVPRIPKYVIAIR